MHRGSIRVARLHQQVQGLRRSTRVHHRLAHRHARRLARRLRQPQLQQRVHRCARLLTMLRALRGWLHRSLLDSVVCSFQCSRSRSSDAFLGSSHDEQSAHMSMRLGDLRVQPSSRARCTDREPRVVVRLARKNWRQVSGARPDPRPALRARNERARRNRTLASRDFSRNTAEQELSCATRGEAVWASNQSRFCGRLLTCSPKTGFVHRQRVPNPWSATCSFRPEVPTRLSSQRRNQGQLYGVHRGGC